MSTVWIVERNIDYEGSFILGVYTTEFDAQRESDRLNEANGLSFMDFSCTEFEVQEESS